MTAVQEICAQVRGYDGAANVDLIERSFAFAAECHAGQKRRSGEPYVVHPVGVGLRALFPWLDRTVFRADIGFPLYRPLDPTTGAPIAPYSFLISFTQAFVTPTVAPTPVLSTGQGPDAP